MGQPWTRVDPVTRKFLPSEMSVEDRFWSYVDKTETCWRWTGKLSTTGYGRFAISPAKQVQAHRFAYEAMVGPIADGLELDHLCRVPVCVRPEHLEPVTHLENVRRGFAVRQKRTHCKRGHEYTSENTAVRAHPKGYQIRLCRQCSLLKCHEYRAQRRKSRVTSRPLVPCRRGCGQQFTALGRPMHEKKCAADTYARMVGE